METTILKKEMKSRMTYRIITSLITYVVVNAFLVFVNLLTCPAYLWVLWVIGGWGIGLFCGVISEYLAYRMGIRQ